MQWIVLSLTIVAATAGATATVLYFIHSWHTDWLKERLLQEKQLAVYHEISVLISNVKATLEYTSGDETLGEWRSAMMIPLKEILGKSYEWAVFLPDPLQDLPSHYAGQIARRLSKLNSLGPNELETFAGVIEEIKQLEHQAAKELQEKIRAELAIF